MSIKSGNTIQKHSEMLNENYFLSRLSVIVYVCINKHSLQRKISSNASKCQFGAGQSELKDYKL